MRVLIACAGTGGHVNPGIAIAKIIASKEKSQFLFVGTETGLENELVKNAGYEIKHIRTGKLYRKITLKNFKSIFDNIAGISDAKKIIAEFKPDIVIGTGGYICGAVALAAKSKKVPYVLHESNVFPGVTVKLLAKKSAKVLVGFETTRERLKNKENVVFVGSPAKFSVDDIDKLNKEKCLEELKLKSLIKDRKVIFVTGGSQGARKFNEVIIDMALKAKSDKFFIVIATGMKNYDDVMEKVAKVPEYNKYIKVKKFVFDMDKMYKVSDILITRAGAMTITEICLAGRASILIPLPYAAENHQLYNAKVLENVDAANIIEEKYLTGDSLLNHINELMDKPNKIEEMGKNARKMAKLGVEEQIYSEVKSVVE